MADRREQMLARRRALQQKIADQRGQLVSVAADWQAPLHFADQAWRAVGFLRSHALLTASLAGLVVLRRRGVTGLLKGGWRLWKAYRYIDQLSGKYMR